MHIQKMNAYSFQDMWTKALFRQDDKFCFFNHTLVSQFSVIESNLYLFHYLEVDEIETEVHKTISVYHLGSFTVAVHKLVILTHHYSL